MMRRKLEESEARIVILEQEGTRKHCIEERRDWKQLVAAVNSDRARIQKENEKLMSENATLSDERDRARASVDALSEQLKRQPDSDSKNASSGRDETSASESGSFAADMARENKTLREENRVLRASAARRHGDGGELHVKTMLDLTAQKEEIDMLRKENQDLKGRILHEASMSGGGLLSDFVSAFRFCSQPPKQKRIVET